MEHFKQQHGNRPHKCPHCSRAYAHKATLQKHVNNVHENPGAYICGICERKFNRKDYLDNHMHTHSDAKDFDCDSCDKSFKTKSLLNAHVSGMHKQEKKYVCDDCGFRTNWNSAFIEHRKLHTGEPTKYKASSKGDNSDVGTETD